MLGMVCSVGALSFVLLCLWSFLSKPVAFEVALALWLCREA
jgi:hypothetical protein